MKPLIPALKERKRYILFKILCKKAEKKEIAEEVTKACSKFLGALDMAKSGTRFLPETYNEKTHTGIIRTGHLYVDKVKSALMFLKSIGSEPAAVNTIRVSGVLKNLKRSTNPR